MSKQQSEQLLLGFLKECGFGEEPNAAQWASRTNKYVEAALDKYLPLFEAQLAEHEREIRIDETSKWKEVTEEIVSKDGVYRGVNYLNKRLVELSTTPQEDSNLHDLAGIKHTEEEG